MLISLLARILIWVVIGRLVWFLLVKLIPKTYLTWLGGVLPILLLVLIVARPDSSGLQVAWQLLSLPLTPLGLALILLGLAFKDGVKKVNSNQVMIATIILLVCSLPIVAYTLVYRLEYAVYAASVARQELCRQGPEFCPVDAQLLADEPVEAIVIFNESKSQVQPGSQPIAARTQLPTNDMVSSQINSLQFGAQIYSDRVRQNGNFPLVVVTGSPNETDPSPAEQRERDLIVEVLREFGVEPSQIQLLGTGLDVRSTVMNVKNQLATQAGFSGTRRVAIVAPALILRRVGLAFAREQIQVVAYASESYRLNAPSAAGLLSDVASLIPSAYALHLTTTAIHEYLATIYYFLRDWLPDFDVLSQGAVNVGGTPRL